MYRSRFQSTIINASDYIVGSIVGITVVNGNIMNIITFHVCVYPISALLVPKACQSSFSNKNIRLSE